jgi:hypothetical protein
MATLGNRSYRKLEGTLNGGMVILAGYFEFNGVNAPTVIKGNGFTVAFTGTGKWTITLDQFYNDFFSVVAGIHIASADNLDFDVEVDTTGFKTAKTIVVKTLTGTVITTPATANGNGISFIVMASRSAYLGVGG